MVSRLFVDTVTVLRSTSNTTGTGGELLPIYTTYIDVVGSFQSISGQSWQIVNQIESFKKMKNFYCGLEDIVDNDRIRKDGIDYNILDVSRYDDHINVVLESRST